MNPQHQFLCSVLALAIALVALGISLLSAFPSLRSLLAIVRDGVLWVALFVVLGGVSYVVWNRMQALSGAPKSDTAQLLPLVNQP